MPRPKFKRPECLQGLEVVGLDFETYFDKDYSLKKKDWPTSLYIQADQFKAQCIGIQHESWSRPQWVKGSEVQAALRQFDWSRTAAMAHHAQFDGYIMNYHYGIKPAFWLCTLSMARALLRSDIGAGLDEVARYYELGNKLPDALNETKGVWDLPAPLLKRLGAYCAQDVNLMWQIFCKMLPQMPDEELRIVNLTVSLFTEPEVLVDRPLAKEALGEALDERRETILKPWNKKRNIDEDQALTILRSDKSFAAELEAAGAEPPTKWSEKQEKPIYAFALTDLKFKELAEHRRKKVREFHAARLAAKSTNEIDKANGLLLRTSKGNAFPIYLKYYGAHTGRWSGGDKINVQNFKRGSKLRKSLIAPPGWRIGVADASQIEARLTAYMAGETKLLEAFADPLRDPYAEFASELFGYTVTKETHPTERFLGKTCILGLGYQMGAPKFRLTLAEGRGGPPLQISAREAQNAVRLYRQTYPNIPILWRQLQNMIPRCLIFGEEVELLNGLFTWRKNEIELPNGMKIRYPGIHSRVNEESGFHEYIFRLKYEERFLYSGSATENQIQAWSRILVGRNALDIEKHVPIITLTHDEIVYLVREHEADDFNDYVVDLMSTPPLEAPDLPLDAEGGHDYCYSK